MWSMTWQALSVRPFLRATNAARKSGPVGSGATRGALSMM